jgi:hypothetical protein
MPIIQFVAAVGGGAPPSIDFVIVGGGEGGYVAVDTFGRRGYGGSVLSAEGKILSFGDTLTVVVGAGGAPASAYTGVAASGSPGGSSSLTIPIHGTFNANGGSTSNANTAEVANWAGTFSGTNQNVTNYPGSGGRSGLACWWQSVGFPSLCSSPSQPAYPGQPGAVYIRTLLSQPIASSYTGASVSTTATHRIYFFDSGGSITF